MEAYTSTLGLLTDSLTHLSTYCFFISFEACPGGREAFRYCVIVIIVSKFCETELGLPMQSRQTQLFRGGISFNTGTFFKVKQKSITLFSCRDVEIEPGCGK